MIDKGVIVNTEKIDPHLTAMIVRSYVRQSTAKPDADDFRAAG
jgi:hypothetical protein